MGLALVALVAIVALARGGYAPGGTLALEIGAGCGLVWMAVYNLWPSSPDRERRHDAWRRMPLHVRHPVLGRWFGRGKAQRADVEILMPGGPGEVDDEPVELDVGRNTYPLGLPIKRTGLGAPLVLLSVWILLSVAPVPLALLEWLSPEAGGFWREARSLLQLDAPSSAPWSLAPFLTLRSFWLWVAVVSVFFLSVSAFRRPDVAARAGLGLLVVGAGSGVLGLVEWTSGLSAFFGRDPIGLRVSGSFGNPNHYAAFQAMLLSVSVGWLAYYRQRHASTSRRGRASSAAMGRGAIAGLGVVLLCLGLVMSLSRAGLAFALAGVAVWVLLTRRTGDRRALAALGLVALGFVVWVGLGPLFSRFEHLEENLVLEQGRTAIWRDSAAAVADYWLTGSGLSSFRYVGATYRSFGGRIFYSWAHNDYLQLVIELGLPGVLLLAWIVIAVVGATRRVRADLAGDAALLQLHSGFVAALAAIALHSVTDFSLHLPANLALLAVVLGVVLGLEPGAERSTRAGRLPRRR